MSDRLNAMHARLAFLVEWCTTSGPPSGVVCSVFCIFIFYLLWQQLQKSDAALPLWVQDRSRNAGGEFVNVVPVPPSLEGTKVRGWRSSHLTLTFRQLVSTSWHKGKQTKKCVDMPLLVGIFNLGRIIWCAYSHCEWTRKPIGVTVTGSSKLHSVKWRRPRSYANYVHSEAGNFHLGVIPWLSQTVGDAPWLFPWSLWWTSSVYKGKIEACWCSPIHVLTWQW